MCAQQSGQTNALSLILQTRFPFTREQTLHFVFSIFALLSQWSLDPLSGAQHPFSPIHPNLTYRKICLPAEPSNDQHHWAGGDDFLFKTGPAAGSSACDGSAILGEAGSLAVRLGTRKQFLRCFEPQQWIPRDSVPTEHGHHILGIQWIGIICTMQHHKVPRQPM